MATDEQVRSVFRTQWHQIAPQCTAVSPSTWRISVGDQRFLASLIPAIQQTRLMAGLCVAEHLARVGFPTGAPVRAADGAFSVPFDGGLLAVVRDVPGRPLDPADPLDQQWWGDLLGAAHRALTGFSHPRLARLAWLGADGPHLSIAPWVRPTVLAAVSAATRLTVTDQLTYGVLHGDPAPEAFRIDPDTGRTGLVDWRAAATGPLVYDLAAAVGYAGGLAAATELVDGYLAAGPVAPDEADAALPVLLRYRLAERLDGYARRIAAPDTADAGPDWAGLEATRDAIELVDKEA
ncbi:MAG: hypothetical protein AUI14_02840 [Actinobacteria bacterium 13_2_20CM_2_71_6]|nr:MAG: hypothetical protein AUI14_02840 [Actinobacteria bacterium 13_2_20CM_2_71_6]